MRVLLFCFGRMIYLAKSLEKCSIGVCSCSAAKRGGEFNTGALFSQLSVCPALTFRKWTAVVQIFSPSHPSLIVTSGFVTGFETLNVTLTPCPAVVVSGLQAKWHLFGSSRSHPSDCLESLATREISMQCFCQQRLAGREFIINIHICCFGHSNPSYTSLLCQALF